MSIDGMFGTGRLPDGDPCDACDGTGHVCSDDGTASYPAGSHGDRLHPWDGLSLRADACDHGGGMPCPVCMIAPGDEPENPPTVVDGQLGPNLLPGRREQRRRIVDDVVSIREAGHTHDELAPRAVKLPHWDPLPPPLDLVAEPDRPVVPMAGGLPADSPRWRRVLDAAARLLGRR